MEPIALLKKIIKKGGVIGVCGKPYVNDKTLAAAYIIECGDHLHSEPVRNLWGNKLTKQISDFRKKKSSLSIPRYQP